MSYTLLLGEFVIRYPDLPRSRLTVWPEDFIIAPDPAPAPGGGSRPLAAGDLALVDSEGRVIDQVAYQANQVRPGRTICFGR